MQNLFSVILKTMPPVGLIALLATGGRADNAAIPWDMHQGGFITALAGDRQGQIWAAVESGGAWRYNPQSGIWTSFTHASTNGGLGDDDVYSIACDQLGRIWCGTGRDGVSVYNGRVWKSFDRLTGPLGCHVVALAVSPLTGDVWGCTENGLFQYVLKTNVWRYYTKASGLPSNQPSCLTFDKHGTLYVGTLCDGIAIGSSSDDYHAWRVVSGPDTLPDAAGGIGLPSSLINCLLSTRTGLVYAGTSYGLARSGDGGFHWRFLRGKEWQERLSGMATPDAPQTIDTGGRILDEDYITALAEDHNGLLYIGHRQNGFSVYDERTAEFDTPPGTYGGYVESLLTTSLDNLIVGTYGDGLVDTGVGPSKPPLQLTLKSTGNAPLPTCAKSPTASQLRELLNSVHAESQPVGKGQAIYVGEDWQTQGDWLGRYGRQYCKLCAADAPLDHDVVSAPGYDVNILMGPHHNPGDSIRRWVNWVKTDNPKSLYDPIAGYRRQAEVDDHGEAYAQTFDGPDIWATVSIPDGVHRLSLYDFNKDGGPTGWGDNRYRDYKIDILAYQTNPGIVQEEAPLAHCRIRNFWGGVYETFVVAGPSKYVVRISRNGSFNTMVDGFFIDRIGWHPSRQDCAAWMGGVHFLAPDPSVPAPLDTHLLDKVLSAEYTAKSQADTADTRTSAELVSAAQSLWDATTLDTAQSIDSISDQTNCLEAYRAAIQANADSVLLGKWRWSLHLWTQSDREQFRSTVEAAHQSLLNLNPDMMNHEY